jgi:hypothetical protein
LAVQLNQFDPVPGFEDYVVGQQYTNRLTSPAAKHRVPDARWLRLNHSFDWEREIAIGQKLCDLVLSR